MAKKSKFAFRFDEMEDLADKIQKMGGSIQEAADEALRQTHDFITPKLDAGIARHHVSGDTGDSLVQTPAIVWENPLLAKVNIGFDLKEGGLPSIFLMWGTPRRKASDMPVDKALKNAAFGPAVKREVARIQREALEAFLQNLRG